MQENKIEYLYHIDTKVDLTKSSENTGKYERIDKLVKSPVIKETNKYFYVPNVPERYKTKETFIAERATAKDYLKTSCYKIDKNTMRAEENKRMYYTHPFIAKESYFVQMNAYTIAKALQNSKNAYLLRQIAHNLELTDLYELNIGETK